MAYSRTLSRVYEFTTRNFSYFLLHYLLLFSLTFAYSSSYALNFLDAKINGIAGVSGLQTASGVALSPDGKNVYATGFTDNAVVTFSRDTTSGALTFSQVLKNSDIGNSGLQGANGVVVSPDNKHVYVTSYNDGAISAFSRNPSTGTLTFINAQTNPAVLAGASSLAISSDNLRVYITAAQANTLSVFDRNTTTGTLTFLGFQKNGANGVTGLSGATQVAVSPDNAYIYVTGSVDNALAVFSRSPSVGELGYVATYQNGVNNITVLNHAYGVTVSPDNQYVYVTSDTDSAVSVFKRNATGLLNFLQVYRNGTNVGGTNVSGLLGARALLIHPNGKYLYVTGTDDNAVVIFDRDSTTGLLTAFNNAIRNGSSTRNINALQGVTAISTNTEGNHVYTAALSSNAVSTFSLVATDVQVTVSKTTNAAINSSLVYLITVTNNGSIQATGVTVTDTLPTGATFTTATPSQGTCAPPAQAGTVITCTLNQLDANKSATILLTITTPSVAGTVMTNTVKVTSVQADSNPDNNSDSANTTLQTTVSAADVEVTSITTDVDPVVIGNTVTYTIMVKDNGPNDVTFPTVTITLPNGATLISATSIDPTATSTTTQTNLCTPSLGIVTCNYSGGKSGSTAKITVQLTAPSAISGATATLSLAAEIKGVEYDPNPLNNKQTKDITVLATPPALKLGIIDAVATPSSVTVNSTITYTVRVSNNGTATATGVILTGTLPPQVQFISSSKCTYASSKVTCNLGQVPNTSPNNVVSVDVQVQGIKTGLNAPATFTVTGNGNNTDPKPSATATVNVTGQLADLVVIAKDSGGPVMVNTPFTYTITVTNNGPDPAGISLTNNIVGTNVTISNVTVKGTCTTGTLFTCTLDAIMGGQNSIVSITVTPTAAGNITLTTTATPINAFDTSQPNTATVQTSVANPSIDLGVTLAANPTTLLVGSGNITYTASVKNAGTNPASDVSLIFVQPDSTTLVSATPSQGSPCVSSTRTSTGNVTQKIITCAIGALSSNGQATATIILTPTATTVTKLTASAEVSSSITDSKPADNTATVDVSVTQIQSDLNVTLTAAPEPVLVGGTLTYTIVAKNSGPEPATTIVLTDVLPTRLTFNSVTVNPTTAGTCTNAAGTVTCNFATLAKDASVTVTIAAQATTAGSVTNTATIKGKEADADSTNNSASKASVINDTPPVVIGGGDVQTGGGTGTVKGLQKVNDLTLSPDGKNLYAVGFGDNSLSVFTRNPVDGKLTFLQVLSSGVSGVDGLGQASGVAVSPDGNFVYATGLNDSAIAIFKRDATTGSLTFTEAVKNGVNGISGISGAYALKIIANHVYVVALGDKAITLFSRDATTGKLTFVESQKQGVGNLQTLDGPNALAISPDGSHVIVASAASKSLTVFGRDATTGRLTLVQSLVNGVGNVQGLDSTGGVVVSPDGLHVYATGAGSDNAVVAFSRVAATGILTFVEAQKNGVGSVTGLNGAMGIGMNPQGTYLYVASLNDSAVAIFSRNTTTGQLRQLDVLKNGVNGVSGLGGARALTVSSSGAQIYVAAFTDNSVATLRISSADMSIISGASPTPVVVGNNLTYTLTVTNNGTDQATNVNVTDTLPADTTFVSATAQQGSCSAPTGGIVNCALGVMNSNTSAVITVIVVPVRSGTYINKAVVSATQIDPISSNNTVTDNSAQAVATADLGITLQASSDPVTIQKELSFVVSVTNNGPNPAFGVKMVDTLPNTARYVSAKIGTDTTTCTFAAIANSLGGTVTCTLGTLNATSKSDITITVLPSQAGTLTNGALVQSDTVDPNPANNNANQSVKVVLNQVDVPQDNQGQVLNDYTVGPNGVVNGGSLSGTIGNQGLITNVKIMPNSTVNGGKMSGNIVNEGTIRNVQLLSNTTITGGIVGGKIMGFPAAPATINARITTGAQLTDVIIGANSVVEPNVILGSGVRFANNSLIPAGIDLTQIFPTLGNVNSGGIAVDLSSDVVLGAESLLAAINALPDLKNNGLAYVQVVDSGQLLLRIGSENIIVRPQKVWQAEATQPAGITVNADDSQVFVTGNRRAILVQPSLESPATLQQALSQLGLTSFQVNNEGTVIVPATNSQSYFAARPDKSTRLADASVASGLSVLPSSLVKGANAAVLTYLDGTGLRRQQFIYPTPAHPLELRALLEGIPGASNVTLSKDGSVSVKIGTRTYTAVCELTVQTGPVSTIPQFLVIPDKNGDGTLDVRILYANGDQQIFYVLPQLDWVAELQSVPEVKNGNYIVQSTADGNVWLIQGSNRWLLRPTRITQAVGDTTSRMVINADGSFMFVTATARQVILQPLLQASVGLLMSVLDNGNLVVPGNATLNYSARPDAKSTLITSSTPNGLGYVPASAVRGMSIARLVFADESSAKRQQFIYPVAKEPDALHSLLANTPGVNSVVFNNDGTVSVSSAASSGLNFKGLFDYGLKTGTAPTGGIQFSATSDMNGDGIADYLVVYGNGDRQVIYQTR